MPSVKDLFPSKYLSADDLPDDQDTVLTIAKVEPYRTQEGEPKAIITFAEGGKPLMANQTNTRTIAKIWGNMTESWVGKRISLYVTEVQYKADMVPAIRIRSKPPQPLKPTKPTRVATQEEIDADNGEEDIPF